MSQDLHSAPYSSRGHNDGRLRNEWVREVGGLQVIKTEPPAFALPPPEPSTTWIKLATIQQQQQEYDDSVDDEIDLGL